MKTSDFRIGNIIQIPGWGGYREITNLSESTFQANSQSIHISKIIPIPLTKELLTEWCGFENGKFENTFLLKINRKLCLFWFSELRYGFLGSSDKAAKYYSIHELQNLYFALTGTELEIKIPTKV